MSANDETYAEWFVWAKRNLVNDVTVSHVAAAAATEAETDGGSREQAIAAARQSLTTGAHRASPGPAELRRRSYAEWFDWARRELGGVREQQHEAARAAIAALDAGQGIDAALTAARQAVGAGLAPPAPPPPAPPPQPAGAGLAPPAANPTPAASVEPTNGLAVASAAVGLFSWILCPVLGGIAAVAMGHAARGQVRRTAAAGGAWATAGLTLGYAQLAFYAVVGLLILFGFCTVNVSGRTS